MTLDIQLCGRYSPNIEIKCIKNVQNEALKRLNLAIQETEAAQISKDSLSKLLLPLKSLKDSIVNSLIGEHEQNTHARNDDTVRRESKIDQELKSVNTVIKNAKINLEAAQSAEKAKIKAYADSLLEETFKEDDGVEDDPFKSKDSTDQTGQTTVTGDHQHYQNHDHFEL
jgi:formylmethanofuran dehydrogenase subunit E-like metal-binding protein